MFRVGLFMAFGMAVNNLLHVNDLLCRLVALMLFEARTTGRNGYRAGLGRMASGIHTTYCRV